MATFETSVELRADMQHVCDFLLRPSNIIAISPPEMNLRFNDPPEKLEAGSRIEFQVSNRGISQTVIHEIIDWSYPSGFAERQVKGPLGTWLHEHRFEAISDSLTRVVDHVDFTPPGGLAGMVMTEAWILNHLQTSFAYRQDRLKTLLDNRIKGD